MAHGIASYVIVCLLSCGLTLAIAGAALFFYARISRDRITSSMRQLEKRLFTRVNEMDAKFKAQIKELPTTPDVKNVAVMVDGLATVARRIDARVKSLECGERQDETRADPLTF